MPDLAVELARAQATIADQAATIAAQAERIWQLEATAVKLNARHRSDQERLVAMDRRIRLLLRQVYGTSNARHEADGGVVNDLLGKTGQRETPDDQVAYPPNNAAGSAASSGTPAAASTDQRAAETSSESKSSTDGASTERKQRRSRLQLPEWLALHDEHIEVPEGERMGPDGQPLPLLGHKISWRLDYVPPHFLRVRILRAIYGKPFDEDTRIVAPPYQAVVEHGLPTDRLVAQVVGDKFDLHLPLYRQEGHLDTLGLPISRATLVNWLGHAATFLKPIHRAIAEAVLAQPVIGLDDTYLPVLQPGKGRCHQGRLWGYLAGEDFFCEYRDTREGRWPAEFLANFRGTVLGDAYSGHKNLFTDGTRIPAGCLNHARMKFDDAVKLGEKRAKRALDHFSALYAVEHQVEGRSAEDILRARQATSVSILDKLEILLQGFLATELPSSATYIAANYTLKIYAQLRQFTRDGRVPIDNNALERCWRGVGIGRRNWLFAGSSRGGERAATLITICQCCRLVGLEVRSYLEGIFKALHQGRTDFMNLRPSAWAAQLQAAARPRSV